MEKKNKPQEAQIVLYQFNDSDKLYCAFPSDQEPNSYHSRTTFETPEQMRQFCLNKFKYIVTLGQPDVFVLSNYQNTYIRDKNSLDNFISRIKQAIQNELMITFFKDQYHYGDQIQVISESSTFLLSSIKFNALTAQKLDYNQYLVSEGLAIPGTVVRYQPFQLGRQIVEKACIGDKVIKFPYASSNACVIVPYVMGQLLNRDKCAGSRLGYLEQPVYEFIFQKIDKKEKEPEELDPELEREIEEERLAIQRITKGRFMEIRCLVVGGMGCIFFMVIGRTWFYFSPESELPDVIAEHWSGTFSQIKETVWKVFHGINRHFQLNEPFMRIDLFLMMIDGQPGVFVNELEPWACGKGKMCERSQCEMDQTLARYIKLDTIQDERQRRATVFINIESALKITVYRYHHEKLQSSQIHPVFMDEWIKVQNDTSIIRQIDRPLNSENIMYSA